MKREDVITAGILGLPLEMFIVLAVLKLTGVIQWSWLWVTIAIWGPVAIIIILAFVYAAILYYKYYHH